MRRMGCELSSVMSFASKPSTFTTDKGWSSQRERVDKLMNAHARFLRKFRSEVQNGP